MPRSTSLRSAGQGLVASLVGSLGSASWARQAELGRPLAEAGRQLVHQEVWRLPGGIRGGQMLRAVDRADLEAERLALAGGVDEDEGIDAVIGLAGEAGRGCDAADRRRDGRVARDEAVECGGLGGVRATRRPPPAAGARKSSAVATGKKASELATMSICEPSGSWKRTAMPCGLALGSPSGIAGRPVASEKRTVTGTGAPANRTAVLSCAPAALGGSCPRRRCPWRGWHAGRSACRTAG